MSYNSFDRLHELFSEAIQKLDIGDISAAKALLERSIETTKALRLAPHDGGIREEEESNCIVCTQFETPVVFAANPFFSMSSSSIARELELSGVEHDSKVIIDLLCANGNTNRFFEGQFCNNRIWDITQVPEERVVQLRELHAQPLQSYAREDRLDMGILSNAQRHMVLRGRPFPISVTVES